MSSAEPQPQLKLPQDFRETAFRAIETVLREDPLLANVVKTWRSREGFASDMIGPGQSELPMIALSPWPKSNEVNAFDLTRINLDIRVELFVQGSCSADILNLWGAVENAVVRSKPFRPGVPGEEEVGMFLARCIDPAPRGVNRLVPTSPGFLGLSLLGKDNKPDYQYGIGTLSCFIERPA